MYTTREFYLKKADAMQAAEEFQKLFGGYIGETSATNDVPWTYIDRDALNLDWGGETEAVQVYASRDGMSGLFAWWEE